MRQIKPYSCFPLCCSRSIGIGLIWTFLAILSILPLACKDKSKAETKLESGSISDTLPPVQSAPMESPLFKVPVDQAIPVKRFFQFVAAIVEQYDSLCNYPLTENLLLRANPWILDTLVHTDYYYQTSVGHFIYEQTKMVVLNPGDTLLIPGPITAQMLLKKMDQTWLDINIPAFQLRIMEGEQSLFHFPVRVGKSQKKHLESAGHIVDLRTRTGNGEIIRVNRFPIFIDPVTGEKFKYTKRDDRKTTLMPQIPWLEPSIDGNRYGQMIHPTTNPRSLGKAASNGCIGLSEADAWKVYFYAPIGTKLKIRYDLQEITASGDTLRFEDVYRLQKTGKTRKMVEAPTAQSSVQVAGICNCDPMF